MPKAITQFDEIYAVGDSISDNGNIFQLSSAALRLLTMAGINTGLQPIPPDPYFEGRFSNGLVLPEITAQLLGATLHDFAFGGATALPSLTFGELASSVIPLDQQATLAAAIPALQPILNHEVSLAGQLQDLSAALTADPPADHSALVTLIGLNDLLSLQGSFDPNDPNSLATITAAVQAEIPQIVAANHQAAVTAFDFGIDTVIYETLPAASFFPIADAHPELQPLGDQAVAAINAGLVQDALAFQQEELDVRVVYTDKMAAEVQQDPGTFGFLNFDVPWSSGDGVHFVPNLSLELLDTTAFFDPLHMTTNLHGVLAVFAAESLSSNTIFAGPSNDPITGTQGDDLVLASAGNDTASLARGNDILLAGTGNDTADGGQGNDLMSGGSGDDHLAGGLDSDVLVGNAGNDTLEGGNNNDVLIDGPGNNMLFGGHGDDYFLFTQPQLVGGAATDTSHIDGGQGNDTVVVRVDPTLLITEQTNVQNNFHAGQAFAFTTTHLTVTGVEHIVLTTDPHFANVTLPGGDLGPLLHEADLFGFI